jgi:hypothetical protein
VIGSSITFQAQSSKVMDSAGAAACMSFHQGRMEATNEVQSCDTAPAVTYDTDWVEGAGSGAIVESNTDYEVGTFSCYRNIARDT